MEKKRNLYVWGWWQGNNLGDNWIKKILSMNFPEAIFIDTRIQEFEKGSFVICGGVVQEFRLCGRIQAV